MLTNDRNQLRKMYYDCWKAHNENQPLDPMQQIIVNIIKLHPEYHGLLENEAHVDKDYLPEHGETNPFLHMSMHIALHEQISTNRPAGITTVYQQLISKYGDAHEAEHHMMECLGEALWQAQRDQLPPNEDNYLSCLKQLC